MVEIWNNLNNLRNDAFCFKEKSVLLSILSWCTFVEQKEINYKEKIKHNEISWTWLKYLSDWILEY